MTNRTSEQTITRNTKVSLGLNIAILGGCLALLTGAINFSGKWGSFESQLSQLISTQRIMLDRQRDIENRITKIEVRMDREDRVK